MNIHDNDDLMNINVHQSMFELYECFIFRT